MSGIGSADLCFLRDFLSIAFVHFILGVVTTVSGVVGTVVLSPDVVATAVEVDRVASSGPSHSIPLRLLARLAALGVRAWLLSSSKPSLWR